MTTATTFSRQNDAGSGASTTKYIGEVKHHVYVKRQINVNLFQVTKFPLYLSFTVQFIISTHNLAVSRNFLSIRTVLSCFYQLIFSFEKFLT